jgi:two-component system NarL family sensor kinase
MFSRLPTGEASTPVQDSPTTDSLLISLDEELEQAADSRRLYRAEREISWLRWGGMIFWLIVLLATTADDPPRPVWIVYLFCLSFTALVQLQISTGNNARFSAWLTMIGDPLLAASICSVTGGTDSIFIPFLYFTSLAAAFRFGVRETLAILALNSALATLLHIFASPPASPMSTLFITIYYNGMAAAIGAMCAGWARANLGLAQSRSRALQLAHGRIRSLLHRLINVQETERKLIADDLHDRIGGRLFTLQQGIDTCREITGNDSPAAAVLDNLAGETRACADDVRMLMNELRPTILDDLGIAETLGELVTTLRERVPFAIELEIDPALRKWRSRQDALLFRLVQEVLLNIRKHASATRVSIHLRRRGDSVLIQLHDDGTGFDPGEVQSGHYGLLIMQERARALGGAVDIASTPGGGTTISITLPA